MIPSFRFAVGVVCLAFGLVGLRAAVIEPAVRGTKIDALTVGATTYHRVEVRSVSVHTVMISHAGGMTSIHLRDLSPDWQARFHYDPAAAAAATAADEAARLAKPTPSAAVRRAKPAVLSKFDTLLQQFDQPATIQPEVDLRPTFFKLELGVKNQGRRPSCAIFAVVSALEFQNAELAGKVEKFSEEYLIWAARKTVNRLPDPSETTESAARKENQDEGFSISEVVAALRAYGIPLQVTMPNTFGRRIESIEDPPAPIIQEARNHHRIHAHQIPGRDMTTLIDNVVQTLNTGYPVVIGMGWPTSRIVNGYLNTQSVSLNQGHAVTLVGYKSATGQIEDAYFIFKNSWGPTWGQGGYGTVTYHYLHQYLSECILLEVQPG